MNEKTRELFKLIQENPDLPIVPMVDSEIVADDGYNRWLGSWGTAYIGEYLTADERIYFRDDDDIEEALAAVIGWDTYEAMSDDEAVQAYKDLPWTTAIIVYIDLPEQEATT